MEDLFSIIASFRCQKINEFHFSDREEKLPEERAVRGCRDRATCVEVLHVPPPGGGASGTGANRTIFFDPGLYLGHLSKMINEFWR